MDLMEQLRDKARANVQKVAFFEADDPKMMEVVGELTKEGLAEGYIAGDGETLRAVAEQVGVDLTNVNVAQASNSATGSYAVNVKLDGEGTQTFADVTKELAPTKGRIAIVLDGTVKSAPAVQNEITGGEVSITGNFTLESAKSLKTVLDSGSLPVTLTYSESRVVGPTLGQDSLNQGVFAIGIGVIIVVAYLFFFYRGLGFLTFGSLAVFAIVAVIFALAVVKECEQAHDCHIGTCNGSKEQAVEFHLPPMSKPMNRRIHDSIAIDKLL